MKTFDFSRHALCISAAAILAACGGSQPSIGAPGAVPQSHAIATHAAHSGSWMLPEAKSENLLYIAAGGQVYVLSYPGGKFVGSLALNAGPLCSDKKGDVFIPQGPYVYEYAHGGSEPIQSLHDADPGVGCAVDQKTGNLAVSNVGSATGDVAIYPKAREPAQYFFDPALLWYGLCGYDDNGNFFLDGENFSNSYILDELPKGGETFTNLALDQRLDAFGSVQWDGKFLTLSNPKTHNIYRLKIQKSSAKIVGATHVRRWYTSFQTFFPFPYVQTWLHGDTFIGQSTTLAKIGSWAYPAGGVPRHVTGPFQQGSVNVLSVTISVAPSR